MVNGSTFQFQKDGEVMGYVYFVTDGHGHMKIGKAENPIKRLKGLQTGNPYDLEFYELIEVPKFEHLVFTAFDLEKVMHEKFQKFKIRDEWFFEEPIQEWLKEVYHDIVNHPRSKYSSAILHYYDIKIKIFDENRHEFGAKRKLTVACWKERW